jgi:hypothetical protein
MLDVFSWFFLSNNPNGFATFADFALFHAGPRAEGAVDGWEGVLMMHPGRAIHAARSKGRHDETISGRCDLTVHLATNIAFARSPAGSTETSVTLARRRGGGLTACVDIRDTGANESRHYIWAAYRL